MKTNKVIKSINNITVCFSFGPMVRQEIREIAISSLRRNLKCSPALAIFCIDIRTTLNKQACDFKVPTI